MKTRLIATLTALTLAALAGTSVRAEDSELTLEWQQPGYVMEVVIVTAPRPAIATAAVDAAMTEDVSLAWQQPGYVEEVVVATASRSEVLATARKAAIEAALARDGLPRSHGRWNWLGAPAR